MKAAFVLAVVCVFSGAMTMHAQQEPNRAGLPDYSTGPNWFPKVFKPYVPSPIVSPVMENSPRLHDLIRNGKLRISVADALALAIENNLDISVQRFVHPIAEADVLRASSGQAARGISGALLPSGLSQGALGVGVNQFQGAGGVGSAGGISGGGGAVQIPQVGSFDPSVSFNFSLDRTLSPLNTWTCAVHSPARLRAERRMLLSRALCLPARLEAVSEITRTFQQAEQAELQFQRQPGKSRLARAVYSIRLFPSM